MRCAYGRLAAQHDDWPALADGAALPGDILSYVEWFYETRPFQNDLRERAHEAVERARARMRRFFGSNGSVWCVNPGMHMGTSTPPACSTKP